MASVLTAPLTCGHCTPERIAAGTPSPISERRIDRRVMGGLCMAASRVPRIVRDDMLHGGPEPARI